MGFNHLNMDINMDVNGNYWTLTNLLINNNQTPPGHHPSALLLAPLVRSHRWTGDLAAAALRHRAGRH